MRFWLAAFVVLFAAVELFQWVAQIGSLQPSGMWLVLGGMGLAAMSNFSRLAAGSAEKVETSAEDEKLKVADAGPSIAATAQDKVVRSPAQKLADQSNDDSISFKVRPLKR